MVTYLLCLCRNHSPGSALCSRETPEAASPRSSGTSGPGELGSSPDSPTASPTASPSKGSPLIKNRYHRGLSIELNVMLKRLAQSLAQSRR